MKIMIVALYLLTGLACTFWSFPTLFLGQYRATLSFFLLHFLVFIGAITMTVGGIMSWVSLKGSSQWISLIGASILIGFFGPTSLIFWRHYGHPEVARNIFDFVFIIVMVVLVLVSFVVAVWSKMSLKSR